MSAVAFDLPEETRALQSVARDFARDVLALESRHLQRITARRAQAGSIDLKTDG